MEIVTSEVSNKENVPISASSQDESTQPKSSHSSSSVISKKFKALLYLIML